MRQLKISKSITNRNVGTLDKFLQDISKEELISAEEEANLAKRIKTGDEVALNKLIISNLRFVVSVAKQYQNQGLSLPDLINEGNIGLIKAAKRFDETRGFKFISYAVWWIRQSILQSIADQSRIVRIPLNQIGTLNKLKKESGKLEQEFERDPSPEELADILDLPQKKVKDVMRVAVRYVSMDAPLTQDEDSNFIDIFIPENGEHTDDSLMKESLQTEIQRSLSFLSERERDVINLFYGIGQPHGFTLDEIANRFDLTRERIRQIKERGLLKLKSGNRSKQLKAYLES